MDENPYEAPRGNADGMPPIRVQIRWWPIVVIIFILGSLVGLLLPALQPGKSSNERQYREWQRQREAERSDSP
jgi:hypothetical protein